MSQDTDKSETKSAKALMKEMDIHDPEQRLRILSDYSASVEIDPNIPLKRYYRSGVEMIRQANVYLDEGCLENAYILYMKFMTLFVEKIIQHPSYDIETKQKRSKDKATNHQLLREVLLKAEALKKQLLEQYRMELDKYLAEAKERERLERDRHKLEEMQRLKEEERNKMTTVTPTKVTKAAINAAALGTPFHERKAVKVPDVTPIPIYYPSLDDLGQSSKDIQVHTPTIDRSTKPSFLTNDKQILRDIILPTSVMQQFLTLSLNNTMNNKETCGILAGKLERNKLIVTHLLIPQQTGTPDSCMTHNEEDFFDYQDQHNLITLGWIHTHPTQTAFLSSVDLHTHCAYQLMMAEAIAIVCAPKYDETGFFILTPDYGLGFIANCRETGFHPHPTEPPLYMKAKHCKLDPTAPVVVVDLRKK